MFDALTQAEIARELDRAEQARLLKNEGMARVCARRAAGLAARAYLSSPGLSALDALTSIRNQVEIPPAVRQNADHLTVRLTSDHQLPVAVDLLAEARHLITQLELLSGGKIDR